LSVVERLHRPEVVRLGLDVEAVLDDVEKVPKLVQLRLRNAHRVLDKNQALAAMVIC